MDGPRIRKNQYGFKSNAHQQGVGAATSTSSGKRKAGKAASAGGGKKAPIKVVFIGNPVRVTTSEAGFRALVQELTGRDADPYKYSSSGGGSSGAAIDVDADDSIGGSPAAEPHQASAPLLLPSPVSTPSSDAASAGGAAQVSSAPAYDDGFAPQLIDNSYSVFSPPTFLYGPHGELRFQS